MVILLGLDENKNSHMIKINEYISSVCKQIRWKICHKLISEELTTHILEQRSLYLSEGDDDKTATEEAIIQMGDPVKLGSDLNGVHKPKHPWFILGVITALFLIGYYFQNQFSLFEDLSFQINKNHYMLSCIAFIICYFIDISLIGKYSKYISIFLTISAVVVSYLSQSNLIEIINPTFFSTITLWVYPFIFGLFVYARIKKGLYGIFLCSLNYIILLMTIILFKPVEYPTSIVLFTISAFIILSYAITENWFGRTVTYNMNKVLIFLIVISIIGMIPLFINPYLLEIFLISYNSENDPLTGGFLFIEIQDVIENAKIIGTSNIKSSIEDLILQEFTLTYLVYRYGLIVLPIVILPILTFLVISIINVVTQKSFLGAILILSILIPTGFQSILYILYSTGIVLVDSSYPFITLYYPEQIIICCLFGLVCSIYRTGYFMRD